MRFPKRAAMIVPIAAALTLGMASTASAGTDCTDYSDNGGAKVTFKAYGEHLLVTDVFGDYHSAVGGIEIYGDGHYYYWNRDGKGTTRDVNLSITDGTSVIVNAFLGDWEGTPSGGISWNSNVVSNAQGVA
ncbi:hypothetical protein G3I40_13715 [Streptomyces sp. SID14478]|uniref:hypothetical protein n=1 Tax=Streptomyces sp. SID14478 TaxID=2706073 RepID=UPI0013DBC33D|nr:hypothetical protein [Streptomyces sp. SID14478]NEB76272.1 hypothetical protein [Streptomyces sp. SID14478]